MAHSLPVRNRSYSRGKGVLAALVAAVLALGLAACGNKGPLFLPQDVPPPADGQNAPQPAPDDTEPEPDGGGR